MFVRILVVFTVTLLAGLAQTNLGTILGNLTDPSGAVLPGARVTATNLATNESRTALTNDTGYYEIAFTFDYSNGSSAGRHTSEIIRLYAER